MGQSIGLMYLTCGWLEAIVYGVNCVLFGFCIRVLTSNTTSSHRVLAATIAQFMLSTAHVIIVLVELLQAFAPGGNPDAYYEARGTLFIAGFYVFTFNSYAQELLLIWRLYGLWGQSLKVCIIPLSLCAAHICIATLATSSWIPTTATDSPHYVTIFGLTGWGLELATTLTANFGIAYRLWKAERETSLLGAQRRIDYHGTLLLIIECGALISTCTIILFSLFLSGHEAALAGVGIATQIATISPLIIVTRVGLARAQSRPTVRTISTNLLEINVLRTENTFRDSTKSLEDGADAKA